MKNKFLVISIFIFIIVLSVGAVSASDTDNTVLSDSEDVSGTVSGDVDVVTVNPGATHGELKYNVPSEAKTVKSADVYVNVYSGSAQNTYGANANISIITKNSQKNYTESLWIEQGSTDGVVYNVNDHTTKCYSDYMIHYNITDFVNGLNGTELKINVDTYNMSGKSFDGKIKLIALVFAYDDGDDDSILYWINSTQLWTKTDVNVTFDTNLVDKYYSLSLTNVVLSSGDGIYRLNNQLIGDADSHTSGSFYYQLNQWNNLSKFVSSGQNILNVVYAGTSTYGSIKNSLSVLKAEKLINNINLKTEYTGAAFAGCNNTLSVQINASKSGKYIIKLSADGKVVDEKEVNLTAGLNTAVLLTDPTVRPVDASTVNGANNNNVTYSVDIINSNKTAGSSSVKVPVLYNGNLGKDLAYPAGGFEPFLNITVNGDIIVDIKDVSSYLGSPALNRLDVWNISLGSDSSIVKSFIYVPYNWFNPNSGIKEDLNMFNATFNGVKVVPSLMYRDQGNLGSYGKYGYGVLVYDVTGLVRKGENSFNLTKLAGTPAVYPSVLVYMYNTTSSNTLKEIYIINGADLLAGTYNLANRTVHADSEISVYSKVTDSAKLYIIAASAQKGEGDIIFNGKVYEDVWNGTTSTTDLYTLNITGLVKNTNDISFKATGATILALPQIIVTTKNIPERVPTTITAPDVTVVYNTNKNLVITLKEDNGKVVSDAKLTVILNGVSKSVKTNSNGQAIVAVPSSLVPNKYKVSITYDGDDTHIKSVGTSNVVVKKASVKLTASKKTFKAKVKTKKYTVTLKNNKAKVMKKVKLTLKVKGKTYKATTNSKGKATFKITKLTKKGKYTAKIRYAGDKYFNKCTKSVKLTIK